MASQHEQAIIQANTFLEGVSALVRLSGGAWALIGGETADDGSRLRVTICLETRYSSEEAPADAHE
jgi:predicted RNase H-related nuclease YkuK (DUF458 family)